MIPWYVYAMKMSKTRVGLTVSLLIVSLSGLLVLQGYLLRSSITLHEQTFDESVARVLANVSEALETNQAVQVFIDMATDTVKGDSVKIVATLESRGTIDTAHRSRMLVTQERSTNDQKAALDSIELSVVNLLDSTVRLRSDSTPLRGIFLGTVDSAGDTISIDDSVPSNVKRARFLQRVMNRIWLAGNYPLEDRVDSLTIDTLLRAAMNEAGLDIEYWYGITLDNSDSVLYANTEDIPALRQSPYGGRLFQFDFLSPNADLKLLIPDRQIFIWSQMIPILISIVILMAIIVFCFVYTFRIIIEQRRGASLMTEFVNNMTHEFKTPISTISLAAEAISRPDVAEIPARVRDFSLVIQDENNRMRRQTEKILQMAALEEGRLKLKREQVDLHEIVSEAASHFVLQIEQRQGLLETNLRAQDHTLIGDKVHISGIVYNLIDNAIKYSPDKVDIQISSLNADGGIYLSIIDHGLGIKEDDLKMVFRKYFRVATGNVHDIKGFGLGLSYVKLMVEAHDGRITLKSRPGEGTRAELYFPLKGLDDAE